LRPTVRLYLFPVIQHITQENGRGTRCSLLHQGKLLMLMHLKLLLHCVPKNCTTELTAVTLSNLNRFSKFFHC